MTRPFAKNILLGFIISLAIGSSFCKVDVNIILEQAIKVPSPDVFATSLVSTLSPGEKGPKPHRHSGPVIGYVIEGSFLFQVSEPPRIIPAGETFYEADGAIHVWCSNASDNSTLKVFATFYGRPGEPLVTFVDGVSRKSRAETLAEARRNT